MYVATYYGASFLSQELHQSFQDIWIPSSDLSFLLGQIRRVQLAHIRTTQTGDRDKERLPLLYPRSHSCGISSRQHFVYVSNSFLKSFKRLFKSLLKFVQYFRFLRKLDFRAVFLQQIIFVHPASQVHFRGGVTLALQVIVLSHRGEITISLVF